MAFPLFRVMPLERKGPLLIPTSYTDTKDPCPVFDGKKWHIFGSAGTSSTENWSVLHAISVSIDGPWKEQPFITIKGIEGPHVAAPSVFFEKTKHLFHMFIQTDFMALDTRVVHLISSDGDTFDYKDVALYSIPLTTEAGIYDPHGAEIAGRKYLTYSGCTIVSRPDVYLAESENGTWNGPWKRLGRILRHEEVPHHNQHGHHDYEWGLEGSQLLELPSGLILLIAVCFLPEGSRGSRQRVFFAIAEKVTGPYHTIGPVLPPESEPRWESGENGHAAGIVIDGKLSLFYQARSVDASEAAWRYGLARFAIADIENVGRTVLKANISTRV